MVLEGGFAWAGKTYDSLSSIAFAISGTKWNGPRFFGLRDKIHNGVKSLVRAQESRWTANHRGPRRFAARSTHGSRPMPALSTRWTPSKPLSPAYLPSIPGTGDSQPSACRSAGSGHYHQGRPAVHRPDHRRHSVHPRAPRLSPAQPLLRWRGQLQGRDLPRRAAGDP